MATAKKKPGLDRFGLRVQRGHTVHRGAALGLVYQVHGELARVHWCGGVEDWSRCDRLEVNQFVGRVHFVGGVV